MTGSILLGATRSVFAVWLLLMTLVPTTARAQFGPCGNNDAPASHNTATCQGVCTQSGSEVTCAMETLCANLDGATADVVTGWGASTHDLSAWGTCISNNIKFCCVFDEGATAVDTVTLIGTDEDDEQLRFRYYDGLIEENLQPWDGDPIHGYIRGLSGDDQIVGSNYAPVDYDETLIGHAGADRIEGNAGGDFLQGGNGDDALIGGDGNDQIWGGDGDDGMEGNNGSDKMCDASGYDVCASNGGNFFDGGAGDDKIWYNESENPLVPCPNIDMDAASTAGVGGSDQCGDANDYTFLGGSCESTLTVEPTLCDGAH